MRVTAFMIGVLVLTIASACGPGRQPIYIDEALVDTTNPIDTITIMPVIDVRPDPFEHVTISTQVRQAGERVLAGKGYKVVKEVLSTPDRRYTSGELAKMSEAELAALGSPERDNLLYLYVEKLERGADEHGEESRVTLSGVLISRAGKQAVWRDRAVGDSNLTGLFTALSGPSTEYEAVYDAVRLLLSTLPDRAKT